MQRRDDVPALCSDLLLCDEPLQNVTAEDGGLTALWLGWGSSWPCLGSHAAAFGRASAGARTAVGLDLPGLSVHVGTGSLSILTHHLAFSGGWVSKEWEYSRSLLSPGLHPGTASLPVHSVGRTSHKATQIQGERNRLRLFMRGAAMSQHKRLGTNGEILVNILANNLPKSDQ